MIAALYVETAGAYAGLPGVDAWDIVRDARTYVGPYPVVAHPPCERWGRFWHGSPRKPHQFALGDDDGCFAAALASVRQWGGVLEHPADSQAWKAHGLTAPPRDGGWHVADFQGGWTCYVEQAHYGHMARKATWLYANGVVLPSLTWGRSPQVLHPGLVEKYGYAYARRKGVVSCIGGKDKKAKRNATPPAFRDLLISIALSAYGLASDISRSATLTGPGTSRSPAIQRRTVLASTSSAAAAATCDSPSAAIAVANSSAVISGADAVDGAAGGAGALAGLLGGSADVGLAVRGQGLGHVDHAALLGAGDGELEARLHVVSAGQVGEAGGDDDFHDPYVGPLALGVNRKDAAMTPAPAPRLWETLIAYREQQQAYEAQRRKVSAAAIAAYQASAAAEKEERA